MPNEDLQNLRILYDEESFKRMCESADVFKAIDIYMANDSGDDEQDVDEVHDDQMFFEGHSDEEADAENITEEAGDTAGEAEEDMEEDDDLNEAPPSPIVLTEEARVEEIVADVVDDEEDGHNLDFQNTPPPSDDDDDTGDHHYDRWIRGSGELRIRQVFESRKEFREAVLEYALMGGWNIRFTRSTKNKCEAKCAVVSETPCGWRIYCSIESSINQWMVKSFQDEHGCNKDGRCKLLSEGVIAKLILDDLRKDPELKPKAILEQIEKKYNFFPSIDQCRKARKRALELIQDEYDEQYARIKDYRNEILE